MERSLKPEYVDEIILDELTATKLKAACVWTLMGDSDSPELLSRLCDLYRISVSDALHWQSF